MQQRADMGYKYLFIIIIFLLSISLNSQIRPSGFGFTSPSHPLVIQMVLVLKMLQVVHMQLNKHTLLQRMGFIGFPMHPK